MSAEIPVLVSTAVSVGLLHTLLGPDHYVPFIAMSQANRWSLRRTMAVTLCCGIGHVGSSILLGFIGLAIGAMLLTLEQIESLRGDLAGWMLVAFGAIYTWWGFTQVWQSKSHAHANGTIHTHKHWFGFQHRHASSEPNGPKGTVEGMTPWMLFLIFAFGPCEALIPLLMYPAAESDWLSVGLVVVAFMIATLAAMVGAVLIGGLGLRCLSNPKLHLYSHPIAGLAILACGLAIKFGL